MAEPKQEIVCVLHGGGGSGAYGGGHIDEKDCTVYRFYMAESTNYCSESFETWMHFKVF